MRTNKLYLLCIRGSELEAKLAALLRGIYVVNVPSTAESQTILIAYSPIATVAAWQEEDNSLLLWAMENYDAFIEANSTSIKEA